MLKMKLQYFGHLMQRTDSLEKTPMLGKTEDKRRRGRQRMKWLDGITNLMAYMEKAVAPHSSTFAWKIPWMEEPGRLQSMGSLE